MTILTKVGLGIIASITGLGFFTYSLLVSNGILVSYAASLLGTAATTMMLWEYHTYYKQRLDSEGLWKTREKERNWKPS